VFDSSGLFDGDMYVCAPFDGDGPSDPVYRVTGTGSVSVFYQKATLLTQGIAFGGGGGFANSLYVVDAGGRRLQRLSPNATATEFGDQVTSGSWADDMVITSGGALGDYAYIADGIRNQVLRMSPSGTTAVFASVPGALALAVGEGAFGDNLYVATYQGNVYRVDPSGNATLFAWGFGIHSPEGGLRGIDISGNEMWLTSDMGVLYRLAPVPEPSGVGGLSGIALALSAVCVWRRLLARRPAP
jgi:hypothetical protein